MPVPCSFCADERSDDFLQVLNPQFLRWSQIGCTLLKSAATTVRISQNTVINLTKTAFACVVKYILRSSGGLWPTLLGSESALGVHGRMRGLCPCVTQMKEHAQCSTGLQVHSQPWCCQPHPCWTSINKWKPRNLPITFPSSSGDSNNF